MTETRDLIRPVALSVRASKFEAARPRAGAIVRERLLQRLAAAADTPIVLISASPGYGKSTLAAQWRARCPRPVAWVNLDRGDNDPIMFLNSIGHALGRVDSVSSELTDELTSDLRLLETGVPALAVELDRLAPLEVILDDVHELTQPQSLGALAHLLEGIGPESQVVLVTRVDPELSLARQRASGDLFEIRADELAFDADETRALASSKGMHLSDEALCVLGERTEGWPAGIALAADALLARATADDVAETITGDHGEIADYLFEVVLARETAERRRFLLATSVLTEMTAPLCDAVLGSFNSSEILAELEHSNSFVIALDDHRGWYRYHNLFAELLRSELDRTDPELARVCLSRAAAWYEREGTSPDEAFRCAHEAGELRRAGRIALASVDGLARHGLLETVRLWLVDCTETELAADPQLALAAAWVYFFQGDPERAQRFAAAAAEGDLDVPSADGATSLRSSLASFSTALASRGIHEMLAEGEFILAAEQGAMTRWLFSGFLAVGIANLLLGRLDDGVEALREGLTITGGHPEFSHVKIVCLGFLTFAFADTGDWPAARKAAQEAAALSAEERLDHTLPGGIGLTARAMVLAHDGDFDRASAELANARRTSHLFHGARWLNADVNLRWGDISLDLGERQAAQEHADTARAALHGYPDPGTLPERLAELDKRISSLTDLQLTPAEIRILPFLPTHLSIKEIAARLYVSPTTVKTHVSSVYAKLSAATRSEAVARMQQLGLTSARRARHDHAGEPK